VYVYSLQRPAHFSLAAFAILPVNRGTVAAEQPEVSDMGLNESSTLTEDALADELRERGYVGVRKRELAEWRKHGLLPPFDRKGGSLGRGKGREKNAWLRPREVIEQAAWVYDLFEVYEYYDDLYSALWLLDYDVPPERVRDSLRRPLEDFVGSIEDLRNWKPDVNLEDVIDDAADAAAQDIAREAAEHQSALWMFQLPEETTAAFLNILINRVESTDIFASRGYNLTDKPFAEGKKALLKWEQTAQEKCVELFGEDTARNLPPGSSDNMMWMVFRNPQFINSYLSLPRLKAVLDECTDEDLATIRRDAQAGRELVRRLSRLISLIEPHMPGEAMPTRADNLQTAFSIGRLCVLADLSFRRAGHGELVDRLVSMSGGLMERFDELLDREGPQMGLQMTEVIKTAMCRMLFAITGECSPIDK
jgi:hypothetical protein